MSNIYGKEVTRFTVSYTLNADKVLDNTTDWKISDTDIDNIDTSLYVEDNSYNDIVDKVFESKGSKSIIVHTDFDDGWGNAYKHVTTLDIEVYPYDVPILNFTWTPEEPTITDEVTFIQDHNDTRDETISQAYGEILNVSIDFYNDNSFDITNISKNDTFTYTFSSKEDDIGIYLEAMYWDGWEEQTTSLLKTLDMANIPPISDYTTEEGGMCIPSYSWSAISTDQDDDDSTLTYEWRMEKLEGEVWNLIDTANTKEYTYPFQYEGDYRVTLKTLDIEGDFTEKSDEFTIAFDTCGSDAVVYSGTIRLEPNRYQMIAIPVEGVKVKEYFLDRLATITDRPVEEIVELVKSYPSSDASSSKYQVFAPGVTNPESSTNFELVQTDGNITEITPFLVSMKDFDGYIDFTWTQDDSVKDIVDE